MKLIFASVFYFLLIFSTAYKTIAKTPYIQELNTGWYFTKDSLLYEAFVPGCIHTDLYKNNLIADPFFGSNDSLLQWIGQKDWIYENDFEMDTILFKKENIVLTFYGLDTYADVYLNDSLILKADNMFRTWTISCKEILRPSGNHLKIIFHSAENKSADLFKSYPYHLPSEPRVMTRKAQYQFGWDFGPRYITSGLWKKVELKGWDLFRIKSTGVQLDTVNSNYAYLTATLNVETTLAGNIGIHVIDKKIKKTLASYQVKIKKGVNEIQLNFEIKNPKLWWCNGYGEAYLYDLAFEVVNQWGYRDIADINYGLRTIELIETPDTAGNSFYFKLNSIPVFMKGANYVPSNIFPSDITNSQYDSLINTAIKSHFNMLRIWGGGIYEDDYFYSSCDKNGILLWQDFMFACGMYPFDSIFLENIKQEAVEQVSRLNNHPCMALFCGNNENSEGWQRWGWQTGLTESEKKIIQTGYQSVFNKILPEVVSKYTILPYWESSPSYGRGDPKHTKTGDAHNWFVWHDGEPFENYDLKVPRFMSEFGFQSYPSEDCLKQVSKNSTDLFHSGIQSHQKNKRGNEIIKNYLLKDYWEPKSISDFIYLSQVLQAEGILKGIEAHRRNKPYCMGSLYWQFNDCWPSISWSSYDFAGQWKPLQFMSANAFKTFMISITEEKDSIAVYLVSDSLSPVTCRLKINAMDFNGKKLKQIKMELTIDSNSVKKIKIAKKSMHINEMDKPDYCIAAILDVEKKMLAEKIFYSGKPNQLPLRDPEITVKSTVIPDGLSLKLACKKPAKNVYLTSSANGFFSDNFFNMVPGKIYEVDFKNILPGIVPELKINSIFGTR